MPLVPSNHNIISPIPGREEYIIVNVLSGNADILSRHDMDQLNNPTDDAIRSEFTTRGYLADLAEEQLAYRLRYIEFLENRENEEIQIFFVPTYSCNFTCSYCYQSEYHPEKHILSKEITDAFFDFVGQKFGDRKKYITLFGGEPFLSGKAHKSNIHYFIEKSREKGIDLAVVTNGYFLDEYLDMLDSSFTREIQITLDGTSQVHDSRRRLKASGPTFHKIVSNIDKCLDKRIQVNLRMVIDRENIDNLPELAAFAIEKGWTESSYFKTQIGRNYELHYCQNGKSKLFDRLSLYRELHDLFKTYPYITRFHKPAFSVIKFLEENGKLPDPLFDSCPACKSEWAMDYTGSIYSCTATVGKPGEKLGTFYPEIKLNDEKIKIWQDRDVIAIEQCKSCNLQLVCGGGCGSLAFNQNNNIHSPDCRPIADLIGLGASAYLGH